MPYVLCVGHDDNDELLLGDVGTVAALFGAAGAFVGAVTLLFITIERSRHRAVGGEGPKGGGVAGEAEMSPIHTPGRGARTISAEVDMGNSNGERVRLLEGRSRVIERAAAALMLPSDVPTLVAGCAQLPARTQV